LLGALALLLCAGSATAAERVALVIGNGDYQKVPSLPNPPRDAADVAASLGRLGFTVTSVLNASGADLRKALIRFGRTAAGADMAVVYYAGHGIEVGGENWLIPVDAELQRDADTESEAVSLKAVTAQVSQARELGLVILDACRKNPFDAKMQRAQRSRAVDRGLARIEPSENVLIAYSAKDGTTASDGDGRNSPFTAALLHNLETPGLEINFLFRKVRDEVLATTRREQQPFVYGSLSGQSIYLKGASESTPAMSATRSAADDALWDFVKSSDAATSFEEFLRRFPASAHAPDARARLDVLKSKQAALAPSAPARSLTANRGSDGSIQFGGSPYCTYKVTLKNPKIEAPVDGRGEVAAATLSLTMVEDSVPPCPHAPLGTRPHSYTGTGTVDAAGAVVLNFAPAAGNAPKAAATFTGKLVDGRMVGTLSVQRTDIGGNLAWKVTSSFK
jgi:uncharacterized caspase-like protein